MFACRKTIESVGVENIFWYIIDWLDPRSNFHWKIHRNDGCKSFSLDLTVVALFHPMVNRYPQNTNQRRVFDFYLDLKKCWQRRSSWWWRVGHAGLFISRATTAYAFNIFHWEDFWAQCRGWGAWLPRHMLSLCFPLPCCVWPQDFWAQCSFHDCGLHSDTTEHFSSELDITIQRDTDQPVIRSSVHKQSLEPLLH